MKKARKRTWRDVLREQGAVEWVLIVLALLVSIGLMFPRYAFAYNWVIPEYNQFGSEYDSLIYRIRVNGAMRDSSKYSAADTVSGGYLADTISLDADTTYTAEVRVHDGSSWGDWGVLVVSARRPSVAASSFDGSGAYSTTIYVIDTSGTDDTLSGKTVIARDLAGTEQAWPQESENGYITYNLDDTVILSIQDTWYTWVTDTHVVSSDTTLDLVGYDNVSPSAPAASSICTVYGYVYEMPSVGGYSEAQWARVVFSLPQNVVNTCDSAITLQRVQVVETNSSGYFTIDLLQSSCMQVNGNNQKYEVWVEGADGMKTRKHKLNIPDDSSTYKLVF